MQKHATMCYCYQLKGCCNDFLCKYIEKSINPRRVITQYIIKGTIYSLTRVVILSCQNCIACLLSLSFEKKVTNKNPFCCCLWKRKSLLRKTLTKKTPRHFTLFSRMTNNSSVVTNGLSIVRFWVMWVLLLFRLTFAFSQPAAGSCHLRTESKLLWKQICSEIFLKWYRKKILCVFHFSLDVTSFFFSPVFEKNESPMLNRSQSNYASTWKLNTHSKA